MPRGGRDEIRLPEGRIIRHELEYESLYTYGQGSPLLARATEVYECSDDDGQTWRPIAGVELHRDEEGDHILVIEIDESRFRDAVVRAGQAMDRSLQERLVYGDGEDNLDSFNTRVQDEGSYQGDDSGGGMLLDELLGNIDSVLSDHEEAKKR